MRTEPLMFEIGGSAIFRDANRCEIPMAENVTRGSRTVQVFMVLHVEISCTPSRPAPCPSFGLKPSPIKN